MKHTLRFLRIEAHGAQEPNILIHLFDNIQENSAIKCQVNFDLQPVVLNFLNTQNTGSIKVFFPQKNAN
jgi:hypothetical protein